MTTVLILFGALASGLPAFGSHNLLPNGDFDEGVVGWTLYSASGSVSWDPLEGASGAGALRLQSGRGFTEAVSGCFEAPEGAIFTVRARVLNRGSARSCSVWVNFYEDQGCSGDETIYDPFGPWPPNIIGVWESSGYTSAALWSTASSMRVVFELVGGNGSGVCWYDDAYLSYAHGPGPVEVPALTESALALQALLLAALAVRALRNRGRRAS